MDVSLSHQCFSLSLFLSLKAMNISLGEDFKKRKKEKKRKKKWRPGPWLGSLSPSGLFSTPELG